MTEHLPREVIEELKAFPERMAAWREANPDEVARIEHARRFLLQRRAEAADEPAPQLIFTQKTKDKVAQRRELRAALERGLSQAHPLAVRTPTPRYTTGEPVPSWKFTAARQAPRRAPWPAVMPGFPMAVRVPILLCAFVITVAIAMAALSWLAWRAFAARMNAAAARLP